MYCCIVTCYLCHNTDNKATILMLGLLSLPSFVLSLQTSTTCPSTWIVSDNFCYKISTEPMDWGRAQQVIMIFYSAIISW